MNIKLIIKLIGLAVLLITANTSWGQPPASWTVNPGLFTNTYSVTTRVNNQCVDINNTGNVLAAFVNGQCRAVKQTNVSNGTNLLALLPIKSNINGEKVYFKMYDSTSATIIDLLDTLIYDAGGSRGSISTPFILYNNHPITDINLDTLSVLESASLSTLLANISVIDVDTPSVAIYSLTPAYGDNSQVTISGNQLLVNGVLNFTTDSTLEIEIRADDIGCSYTKQFVVKLIDVVYPPIAINDTAITNEDTVVSISVLINDSDLDADIDSSSVTSIGGPTNGTIQIDTNGVISYTPNTDYNGTDSIAYQVCDYSVPTPFCDSAVVYITIMPIDDAPVVNPDTLVVIEDSLTGLDVLLNDTDPENNINPGSLSIVSQPLHGAAIVVSGKIEYLPATFYNGLDTLVYAVCDSTSPTPLCDTGILIIYVIPVPTPPIDIVIDTLFISEDNEYSAKVSFMHSIDNDPIEAFTYDLVYGQGDEDNSQFSIEDSTLIINTKTNYDIKQEYNFRIKSTDLYGLDFEKSFVLKVIDVEGNNIPLPSTNFLSPNGDGKNDFWIVENVEIYKYFELVILDQYGQIIYERKEGYDNTWDGKYKGNPLPTGNYYYIFRNENKLFKGNIAIVSHN